MSESPNAVRTPTCRVVDAGKAFRGKQGHIYRPGISAETAGAEALHLQLMEIPPGERGKAHKHTAHETAFYVLSGESGCWYGPDLEEHVIAGAGSFVYIPADMPHLPYNRSMTEAFVAVIARTDPNEQESVVLLPELERRWEARGHGGGAAGLRDRARQALPA